MKIQLALMLLFLVVLLYLFQFFFRSTPLLFPKHSSLQQPPPSNPVEYDYPFCVQKVSSLGHPISPIIPSSCNAGIALLFPNGTVLPPGGFPFVLPNVTHKGVIIIKFAFVRLYPYCLQLMLGLPKSEEIVPVNSTCENGIALYYPNGTIILPNGTRMSDTSGEGKWGIGVYGVDKWGVPVYQHCMQAVTMSGTPIAPVVPLHSSCQNGVALLYPNGTVILPNGVRVNIPYDPAFNTSIAIWNG
jgi:hypothetical protein